MDRTDSKSTSRGTTTAQVATQEAPVKVRLGHGVAPWSAQPKVRLGDGVKPWLPAAKR